jgi:hypothetical protein
VTVSIADAPGGTVEAELIIAVMRKFEHFDKLERRVEELEEGGERTREGLQMIARHIRVACDAVAAAAQIAEDLSRETPPAVPG